MMCIILLILVINKSLVGISVKHEKQWEASVHDGNEFLTCKPNFYVTKLPNRKLIVYEKMWIKIMQQYILPSQLTWRPKKEKKKGIKKRKKKKPFEGVFKNVSFTAFQCPSNILALKLLYNYFVSYFSYSFETAWGQQWTKRNLKRSWRLPIIELYIPTTYRQSLRFWIRYLLSL